MAVADPLRLVFVSYEFPPQFGGGIGTFLGAIAPALAERAHRVTVVSVHGGDFVHRESVRGIDVVRLPAPAADPAAGEPDGTLAYWHARSAAVARYLARLCAAERIDAIEFPDYRGEGYSFLSRTPPGRRPLCTVRLHTPLCVLDQYNRAAPRRESLIGFENEALRLADRVLAPCEAMRREMLRAAPDLEALVGPIELSPHAVDPAFLASATPDEQAAPEEARNILYVGRMEERKGVLVLAGALARVFGEFPSARADFVGGDVPFSSTEPSTRAVVERILRETLTTEQLSRVTIHGPLDRARTLEHYRAADICVFPSLFENFPNVCLEAMSLGRVVIGSDNSGMVDMLEDGVSGLLCRAGSVQSTGDAIARALRTDADARARMGDAARRAVLERFSPPVIAERFEALYRDLIGRHTGRHVSAILPERPLIDPTPVPCPPVLAEPSRRARTVSVVIPCYNHGRFLGEALRSVREQTWGQDSGIFTVVVDDGSNDPETVRVLDELERDAATRGDLRVIRQANAGLAAARNAGVRATDSEFFVPLDADDCLEPRFIERLIGPLLDDPSLGYCYSHCRHFGAASGVWECPDYDPRRLLVANLSTASAVVRRDAFELAGGYSAAMVHGFEDWDFWIALLTVGFRGRCVPEPLFLYRKHPESAGSMLSNTQQNRPAMVRRFIERHLTLFERHVVGSLAEKDSMFFEAHMQAWRNAQALDLERRRTPPPATTPSPAALRAAAAAQAARRAHERAAQAELDSIEGSLAWRLIAGLKRTWFYSAIARWRWGPRWRELEASDAAPERLARLKAGRAYRLIHSVKATALYRAYARRRRRPEPALVVVRARSAPVAGSGAAEQRV